METPSGERTHIAFFGCRNAGKSTLVNILLGQDLCIVSDVKGTTTDPVSKSMELLPFGPVVLIDTPGYDDEGELGKKRISKTRQILNRADIAVLVISSTGGITDTDLAFEKLIKEKGIPYFIYENKNLPNARAELLSAIEKLYPAAKTEKKILDGLIKAKDSVILVCPIDEAAPKGRLILPQQLVLREIIDMHATAIVCQPEELKETMEGLRVPPAMVITDSQAFRQVLPVVDEKVPLTSFSILMARYKGFLDESRKAIGALDSLKDGDRILIAEGCSHRRQCGDIGTVKIPAALKKITGKELAIETVSGSQFPEDLSPFAMIIHCGGCMITEREVLFRMKCAQDQGIPFCNYGIFLAHAAGIPVM
ncbi:MAG: GTP-binding protein [Treponema sp.]|nr:GTP-binding protein [Candidatus Treponema equi]